MANRRILGNFLAMLLLFLAGTVLRDSWLADGLRYLAFGYISIDLLLRARVGYLRRRPYWTPESWHRYLKVSSIPVAALVIMVLMMAALEWLNHGDPSRPCALPKWLT